MTRRSATTPLTRTAACAFVGLLDVEGRSADNAAYSPAGTQFQECLLRALNGTALDVTHVYALRPVPSFPRHRKLFFGPRRVVLAGGIQSTLIEFINLGPLKTFTSGMALFPRLVAWAWRERRRPRVIMQYNLSSPPGFIGVLVARLTGSRVVPIVADLQVPGDGLLPDTLPRRVEFWLQRQTLPLCDGLIVLTRRMAMDFAPRVPFIQMEGALPDNLVVASRGPDYPKAERPESTPTRVIMYAGGLSELKGIPLLLESFSRIQGNEYRLWITGIGPLRDLVEASAERDPRIKYWGFPSQRELLTLYQAADVLVNPHSVRLRSARYLFPSKLIEYLGTGTPVISTCSTPEVVVEYATLMFPIEEDSPDVLADKIRTVLALPRSELQDIGYKAGEYVRTHKTWAVQARRIGEFVCALNAPS